MKSVYVTGSSGQIGGEIYRLFPDAVFLTREDVDISIPESVKFYFQDKKPELIINCAAYTQVDLAENEYEIARACNSSSPLIMAGLCEKFLHFSTDYVFKGQDYKPYLETDQPEPESIYGKTKYQGEREILSVNPNAVIIRTSWVYSDIGKNFVKTMLNLSKTRNELRVVADQIGSPTYAHDIARVVVDNALLKWNFEGGIYHFTNEGVASWYDFAKAIFEIKNVDCHVIPIKSEEYPTPAKRPHYSVLDKTKIKKQLNIEIPYWKESLKICLQKLS